MRALVLLATFALLTAPAVSASAAAGPTIDPEVTVSPEGCDTCVGVSLHANDPGPDNCADCPTHDVFVGISFDGRSATVDTHVCRGGFFYVCFVDETVRVG